MKRRDRVMECTIAAIAGIGIAAILTASLGIRSSGESTPLKSEAATVANQSTIADVRPGKAKQAAPRHPVRKRHVRSHHRRRTHVVTAPAAPARAPVVAQAAPVVTHTPVRSTPTPYVAPRPAPVSKPAPAPKPAPAKAPSRPKPSGVSFDDSG